MARSKESPESKLLSVHGLTSELSISPRSVWRLISAGAFKVVRIGRSVRVTRASVDAFIARGGAK